MADEACLCIVFFHTQPCNRVQECASFQQRPTSDFSVVALPMASPPSPRPESEKPLRSSCRDEDFDRFPELPTGVQVPQAVKYRLGDFQPFAHH